MRRTDGQILERRPFEYPPECYNPARGLLKRQHAYLETVEAQAITYRSDGLRINGFLVKPKQAGPHPCIICNRGGNRDFAVMDERAVIQLLCRIASWGYVVVASQYRGGGGSEGRDEFGGRDLEDVLNLFPLLDAESGADASRIGMYGGSRGGMMTYLALARTDRVRAAVVRCGVSDLTDWKEDRTDMEPVFRELIPGFDADAEAALVARSALRWAEKLDKSAPILLLQGTADWRVNPVSALRLAERLLAVRHPFRLVMLEGSDHALSEHIAELNRLAREWFDRFVKKRAPLPEMQPHGD